MGYNGGLFTDIIGTDSRNGVETVEVVVVGPKVMTTATKDLRARAVAVMEAGVVDIAGKTVDDITAGEIERFTEITDKRLIRNENEVSSVLPTQIPDMMMRGVEGYKYEVEVRSQ